MASKLPGNYKFEHSTDGESNTGFRGSSIGFQRSSIPKINLMLIGKTGSGKGSLGNCILGREAFVVNFAFFSTNIYEAVAKTGNVSGRNVKVVDTPGVFDTDPDNEDKVIAGICDGITHCSEGVDAFLIVLRLDVRLSPEEFASVEKLDMLFGEKFWRFVILVFTHGDCIGNDPKKFKDCVDEAVNRIPKLKELMSKLETEPQLVDASSKKQNDVVSGQITTLMTAIDQLALKSKGKYTNILFEIAQKSAHQSAEVEKQQKLLMSELNSLKAGRQKDQNRIAELERATQANALQLKATNADVVKLMMTSAKKICTIS